VALPPGTRLQLGDAAVLEIVKGRSGCTRLEAAQGKSITGLGPIGMLARVITSGPIRVGDPVRVLEVVAG
jgi:MOSC domain-containing protein YiiM